MQQMITEILINPNSLLFYSSFWLLFEYEKLGKLIAIGNPFEMPTAISSLPRPIQNFTILLSNNFIVYPVIIGILVFCFFVEPWYTPLIGVITGYIVGYLLSQVNLIRTILGYLGLSLVGPLWLLGFGQYVYHLVSLVGQ